MRPSFMPVLLLRARRAGQRDGSPRPSECAAPREPVARGHAGDIAGSRARMATSLRSQTLASLHLPEGFYFQEDVSPPLHRDRTSCFVHPTPGVGFPLLLR